MRRTKISYTRLYDDPTILFRGCKVFINVGGDVAGIRIESEDGKRAITIHGADGPAGLGVELRRGIMGEALTVSGNAADNELTPLTPVDHAYLSVCQYRRDPWSQKFKAWYGRKHEGDDSVPYPGPVPADR